MTANPNDPGGKPSRGTWTAIVVGIVAVIAVTAALMWGSTVDTVNDEAVRQTVPPDPTEVTNKAARAPGEDTVPTGTVSVPQVQPPEGPQEEQPYQVPDDQLPVNQGAPPAQ